MFMFQYSPENTVNNATSFYSIELITFARIGKVFGAEDEFELLKVDLVFAKDFRKDLFEF
ncbi:DNA topoisomerase [Neisseria sp. HMSC078H04]|nr:DNA topoisomerase [Neisseria sp. HMSC078H04]